VTRRPPPSSTGDSPPGPKTSVLPVVEAPPTDLISTLSVFSRRSDPANVLDMSPPSRVSKLLLALLTAVLGTVGLAATVSAAPTSLATAPAASATCGDTSGFRQVALSSLPPEATKTVRLIQTNGPFPYPQDGAVFGNREGHLPQCSYGYYHEYTVVTPGSPTRGARRIITGGTAYFYTADHYRSFVLVDIKR
jgi:ribonuclease T1